MSTFMKAGHPWLYDADSGDIVGVRDADGGDTYFAREARDANGNVTGLVGTDGQNVSPRMCFITNLGGTNTSIANGSTGALTEYTKIGLDTALVDTDSAADLVNSKIIVPSWAKWVKVAGHVSFPGQSGSASKASIHLWREIPSAGVLTTQGAISYASYGTWVGAGDKPTPEAHYHNRIYYPSDAAPAATDYISCLAVTPWVQVMAVGEKWTLYAWQKTGGAVTTPTGVENWLSVEFM